MAQDFGPHYYANAYPEGCGVATPCRSTVDRIALIGRVGIWRITKQTSSRGERLCARWGHDWPLPPQRLVCARCGLRV